jgi:hypothetical protein
MVDTIDVTSDEDTEQLAAGAELVELNTLTVEDDNSELMTDDNALVMEEMLIDSDDVVELVEASEEEVLVDDGELAEDDAIDWLDTALKLLDDDDVFVDKVLDFFEDVE